MIKAAFLLFLLSSGTLVLSELNYWLKIGKLEEWARRIREEEEMSGLPSMEMHGVFMGRLMVEGNRAVGTVIGCLLSLAGIATLVIGSIKKERIRGTELVTKNPRDLFRT